MDDARLATSLGTVAAPNGGFAAGTLIHTQQGLCPIGQVRVGDWVLSQPEAKDGSTPAYKQVVNTFAFEDKEVFLVRCYRSEGGGTDQFIVTGNHPFWVKGIGWTRADQLGVGCAIELEDGNEALTLCATQVYRTVQPGIGWVRGAWGFVANDGSGDQVDMRDGAITIGIQEAANWEFLDDDGSYAPFHARVFNLEIDDFHTYYVGAEGIWVHSANCGYSSVDSCVG